MEKSNLEETEIMQKQKPQKQSSSVSEIGKICETINTLEVERAFRNKKRTLEN